jgi:NAD(P)-dependent dehydrogenase (short-subunit alcohol dehydrogenase family)
MTDLKNKIALITGSVRGIGKSIALRYASKGADIVVNYSRDKENADETVREIEALGVRAIGVQANVADVVTEVLVGRIDSDATSFRRAQLDWRPEKTLDELLAQS